MAQKAGLCLVLLVSIAFGAMTEWRSAFQHTRKTDLGVYLRAAWAVRTGNDLYEIKNERGWHYAYPPLFAILMTPLADPPPGASRAGYVPYAVSVGLWYALTLFLGLTGVHLLANALEETSADPSVRGQPLFCRRWWALRALPVLILLPAIGWSQGRGQVGLVLAFLFCGAAASFLRGRRLSGGLWLSMAVCIKMIPAFLLLLPAWRRDSRTLLGSFIGLVLGLIAVPVLVMGPRAALDANRTFYNEVVLGGAVQKAEGTLGRELTGITSTDTSSPMAVMHKFMYPFGENRPSVPATGVRIAHWLFGMILTVITLYAVGWKSPGRFHGRIEAAPREILSFLTLIPVMLILSPIFHSHYFSMTAPLVTVLLAIIWERRPYPEMPSGWAAMFLILIGIEVIVSFDFGIFLLLRDFGLLLLATVLLWAYCISLLRNTATRRP